MKLALKVGMQHPLRPHWVLHRWSPAEEDEDWQRRDGGQCGTVGVPNDAERVASLDRYDARWPMDAPGPGHPSREVLP